ncbi:MAG: ATP-binding protein [Chlorobi bacterium]|nr:ATP-binding protein [Chlorobiota bacterium]
MHRTPLSNLIHHAKLPFVGRDAQLAELRRFWQNTQRQLRVGLVVGEAGVGKSTLLERFFAELGDDCTRAHIRFTPHASTSLVRAVARALEHSVGDQPGYSHPPLAWRTPHDLADAIAAIASNTRLLLVLEDIHLLKEDGIQQLALLLGLLGAVRLPVLCLARPLPLGAMESLQGHLDTTIMLEGLREKEIVSLWHQLFAQQPQAAIIDSITATTLGNPLVIRSGLLRALNSQAIQATVLPQRMEVSVQLPSMQESFADSTRSISGTITQHLPAVELRRLQTLATLGEVFSTEAARIAIPEAEQLLQECQDRGLLSVASSAHISLVPTTVPPCSLLSFSHTVMHRELLSEAAANTAALLRVVASELPLYSTIPFSLLVHASDVEQFGKAELLEALQGIYSYLGAAYASDDWMLSETPLRAAGRLIQALNTICEGDDDEALIEARISFVMLKMERSARIPDVQAYGEELAELQQLTASENLPPALRHYQLAGKSATARNLAFYQPELLLDAVKDLLTEAQQLQQHAGGAYPTGLRITLVALLSLGRRCRHYSAIYWAAQHLEAVLESLDLHNPVELEEYAETLPFVMFVRRSQAEFAKRLQSLARLESFGPLPSALLSTKGHLLVMQGDAKAGIAILDEVIPRMQKHQLYTHLISTTGTLVAALGMLGESLETMIEQANNLLRNVPPSLPNMALETALAQTAILAYNIEDVVAVERLLPDVQNKANKKVLQYFATAQRDVGRIQQMEPPSPDPRDPYRVIADVFDSAELTPVIEEQMVEKLEMEIVEVLDLLQFRALLLAVEWMGERAYPIQQRLLPVAQEGIRQWLRWLVQREVTPYASSLVERFGALLPASEAEGWEVEIGVLGKQA